MDESLFEIPQLLEPSLAYLEAHASSLDQESKFPRMLLQQVLESGYCRLFNPRNWQEVVPGQPTPDVPAPDQIRRVRFELQERLAAACGTAHFLAGQQISAVAFLATSRNLQLVEENLAAWETGERLCGIGFSHLGRMVQNFDPEAAAVKVTVGEKYYFLSGEIPWVSGWGIYDDYVIGGYATSPVSNKTPNSRFLYVKINSFDPSIDATPMPRQSAFNASSTVTLRFTDLKVPKDQWVTLLGMDELRRAQVVGVVRFAIASLGIVRAACKLFPAKEAAWAQMFLDQARALRERILSKVWSVPALQQEALQVRGAGNLLALHAAQAAMMLAGGSANDADHPTQRLLREASFHFVFSSPPFVRKALLAQLAEAFPPELELA